MNKEYSGSTGMKLAVAIIAMLLFSSSLLMLSDKDSEAAIDKGTLETPLESLDCGSYDLFGTFYIKVGSTVEVVKEYNAGFAGWRYISSVTPGFGLSTVDDPEGASEGSTILSGTITKAGTIQLDMKIKKVTSNEIITSEPVIIYAVSDGVSIDSISISGPSSVDMGKTINLTASISPSDATNNNLSWSVSDKNVAVGYKNDDPTVFTLIGLSNGTVTVTAESTDGSGKSATYEVKVNSASIETTTLSVKECANSDSTINVKPNVSLIYFEETFETMGIDYSLYNLPKEVVYIDLDTAVMIANAGETTLHWTSYSDYTSTREYGEFTISVSYTLTFNANGGYFDDKSTIKTINVIDVVSLPSVIHDSKSFQGWFDSISGGNCVGTVGTDYMPNGNVTLYAHWGYPSLLVTAEYQWSGIDGGILEYTPSVKDSVTGNAVTGFKVTIESDQTNCLSADASSIIGMMTNLIPGEYSAVIAIAKTGYETAKQTITISMPVTTLEPITANVVVGTEYPINLTLKPDTASITDYKVQLNGVTASSSTYTASMVGSTGFKITCENEGVYKVSLILTAPGVGSSTKTVTLNATEPEDISEPPTISKITSTKYTGNNTPNTYYFTAVGAANYHTITWDFGDGTADSGVNVIHSFKVGNYTITCTVKNTSTGKTANATYSLETLDEDSIDVSGIINIGAPYEAWFIANYSNMVLSCAVSDGSNAPDFNTTVEKVSSGYLFKVSGTCNDQSLVGKTISFTVKSGSNVVKTWSALVCAASSSDDPLLKPSCKYTMNSLTIVLKEIQPNRESMILTVDWGDGSPFSKGVASGSFSHEYSAEGKYTVQMEWVWRDSTGASYNKAYSFDATAGVSVGQTFSITYDPNGGKGSMNPQTGLEKYNILDCTFTYDGKEFVKWCTDKDPMKGDIYSPGESITPGEDITLYALWTDSGSADDDSVLRYVALAIVLCLGLIIVVRLWM